MFKKYIYCFFCLFCLPLVFAYADITQHANVQAFIRTMSTQEGFNRDDLNALFQTVSFNRQVLNKIQSPYEKKPWYIYRANFMTENRVRDGVKFWHRYRYLLNDIEKTTGVPASVIVALMGVESNYGQLRGKFSVLEALSTLAFAYPPRETFFRSELKAYLLMCRELQLKPRALTGSYAGAIGMPQFMPSSYRRYAVSASRRRAPDLVNNVPDVLWSIANYLKKFNWKPNQPITALATVHRNASCRLNFSSKPTHTLSHFSQCGVESKHPIASPARLAALQAFDMKNGKQYWLTFHNFQVITRYNTSSLYALAVYQLSNALEYRNENPLLKPRRKHVH